MYIPESVLCLARNMDLEVYSELDEGTKVVIHIPAIPYTKENAEQLEKQTYGQRRMPDEEE